MSDLEQGTPTNPMYQHMTDLPEALERALLKRPLSALVEACGWAGASEKYTCVQFMARTWDEKKVKAWLEDHPADTGEGQAASRLFRPGVNQPVVYHGLSPDVTDATVKKALENKQVPVEAKRSRLNEATLVKLAKGTTTIQPGSLRAKVITELKARKEQSGSLAELSTALGFDVKPVVAKLREAGWVEVVS